MNKSIAIALSTLLILAISCGKSKEDVNKELYNQVMDVHDEMMPEMEQLYNLKKKLRTKITLADSLQEDKSDLQARLNQVDSASNSMMVWMREFNPEELEGDELTTYLKSELEKVNAMKAIMKRALEQNANLQ